MITQIQEYRWTNCRCIFESYYDIIGMIIIIGLAMIGVIALVDEYIKRKK